MWSQMYGTQVMNRDMKEHILTLPSVLQNPAFVIKVLIILGITEQKLVKCCLRKLTNADPILYWNSPEQTFFFGKVST
jgi:hypothetical protein